MKVERLSLLCGATLLAACATAPEARPPTRATRFVLVPLSARLRQRPADDAPGVQLRPGGPSLEVAVFRRVRRRGAWVLVEPPSRPARQCHPSLSLPEGIRLRFWVRGDELAPALVRTVQRRGEDGSTLRAQAGLRVVREGEVARVALSPGTQVELTLDPSEVGEEFREPRPTAVEEPGERLTSDVNAPFLGNGRLITSRGAAPLYVTRRRVAGGGHLARIHTACAGVEAVVLPRQVVPVMSVEVSEREGPPRAEPDGVELSAGTRLRWPDGGLAGTVFADARLAAETRRVGEMPCYSIPLTVEGVDGLRPARVEVCAEPAAEP